MSRKPRQRGGSGWFMRMVKKTPASGRYRFNHVYICLHDSEELCLFDNFDTWHATLVIVSETRFHLDKWTFHKHIGILYQFILVFKATFGAKNWETMPGGLEVPQSHRSAFGQGSAPKSRLFSDELKPGKYRRLMLHISRLN